MKRWIAERPFVSLPDFHTVKKAPYFGHQAKVEHFESIFRETNTPFLIDSSLFWNGKSFVCLIDGARVGFVVEITDCVDFVHELFNLHSCDLVFQIHGPPEVFDVDHVYPFSPASFGYHNTTWAHYERMLSRLYYQPGRPMENGEPKKIMAYLGGQRPFRPCRDGAEKNLKAYSNPNNREYELVIDDYYPWWEHYMMEGNNAFIAIGAPGMNTHMIDKTIIQYIAFGIAFVHPRIPEYLLPPGLDEGTHYIACRDDYSDLCDILAWYEERPQELEAMGFNLRRYFRANLTPAPLLAYIKRCIQHTHRVKTQQTTYLSPERLEQAIDDGRQARRVERYRLARDYAFGGVFDFGCGSGYGSDILLGSDVVTCYTGYDTDANLIAYARRNYESDLRRFSTTIDIPSASTVLALEVLEHMADLKPFMDVIKKLEPKRIIITFPARDTLGVNSTHQVNRTPEGIRLAFQHWYTVEKQGYTNSDETVYMVLDSINGN